MKAIKECSKCGKIKPVTSFRSGRNQCAACVKAYRKAYSQSDKRKDYQKVYYKAYRQLDKAKAYQKAYRKAYSQSDKAKAYKKAYQKAYSQSDKAKAYRKAYSQSEEGALTSLARSLKIPRDQIPLELVKLQHANLQIKRELRA